MMVNQRIRKGPGHTRFWWMLTGLLVLLFLRYALQINIPRIGYLVIIALITALGDPTEIVAMYISLIPLHESVDFYYAIVICTAVYILKYSHKIKINLSVILVLIMIVWELLHCLNPDFSPVTFVTSVTPLISLAVIMSSDPSEWDYDFIVRALAVTAAAASVTLLGRVVYLAGFNIEKAVSNLRRLGSTMGEPAKKMLASGGTIHPNSLGIINVLVTTGLLQLRLSGRNKKADIPLIMIMLVFGALTSSRTFVACLAMMVLLLIMGQKGDIKQKARFLGSVLLTLVAVFGLLAVFFPDLLEYFISRFFVKDITTGRDTLMLDYHAFITDNPSVMFFGIGLQDYIEKLMEVYHFVNVPHNSVQEIIVAWGIPGLLLVVVMVLMIMAVSRRRTERHALLNYIPLIIVLFKSMAGQLLTSGYSMLTLSYAYLSLCQDFQPKQK